jgi:hypothetical protein
MTESPDEKSAVERLLDLAVYAPLGLALTVFEAMPGLARKGRSRLGPQISIAETVGQIAVRRGYRQFVSFATSRGPALFRDVGPFGASGSFRAHATEQPAPARTAGPQDAVGGSANGTRAEGTKHQAGPPPHRGAATTTAGGDGLAAAELAIPSYDSLSAPQVVQRLAGLSREEVEAIRAYEAATRGRRTILARTEQLLA